MNFNNVAKKWDNKRRIERAKIISDEIKNNIVKEENKSVLEFGCGTGLISFNLVDYFNKITLIDNSEEMIKVVDNKIKTFNINNMKSICCDLENYNISENYDVVYTSMVLHHIVNVEDIIRRFYSLLNNKGELCIIDLNKEDGRFHEEEKDFNGHNGFSQIELKEVLSQVGFSNIKSYTFYNGVKDVNKEKVEYSLFIMIGKK